MRRELVLLWLVGCARSDDATTKKRKKRASKDWSKVDLDAVGREWESGDAADELKTESQVYEEMIERRRAASEDGGWMDPAQITKLDPKKLTDQMAHQQSDTGAAMLFVTLTDKQMTGANKGDAWSEKSEQQFAGICVEIKILRCVRIVLLHAIDATPARWRGVVVYSARFSHHGRVLRRERICTRHTG